MQITIGPWTIAMSLYVLGVVVMARRFAVLATVDAADEPGPAVGPSASWLCALGWPIVAGLLVASDAALLVLCACSRRLTRLHRRR